MQPISFTQRQRGVSIVELLIGVAVGLFILGGALKLFSDYINNNRRLVLETRVNQDMRAAADLIARDLRRAGYWGNPIAGVVTTNNMPVALASKYAPITQFTSPIAATVYSYSQGIEDNELDITKENFGFRLSSGVLQYLQGGSSWQDITDSNTLTVSNFAITPTSGQSCVSLAQYCTSNVTAACATAACAVDASGCPSSACATCPFIKVRSYDIALQGKSTADASIVRSIQETVRARSDQLLGSCPL